MTKRTIVKNVAVVRFSNFLKKCTKSNKKSLLYKKFSGRIL